MNFLSNGGSVHAFKDGGVDGLHIQLVPQGPGSHPCLACRGHLFSRLTEKMMTVGRIIRDATKTLG